MNFVFLLSVVSCRCLQRDFRIQSCPFSRRVIIEEQRSQYFSLFFQAFYFMSRHRFHSFSNCKLSQHHGKIVGWFLVPSLWVTNLQLTFFKSGCFLNLSAQSDLSTDSLSLLILIVMTSCEKQCIDVPLPSLRFCKSELSG